MKTNTQTNTRKNTSIKSKKMIIATVVMAALSTSSVYATESNLTLAEKKQAQTNNENIGFGTGMLIGAVAAGPIGAIVAGVGGVFVAQFINVNDDNEELSQALINEQQAHQLANNKAQQSKEKLQRLESSYQQQLALLENQQQQTKQLQAEHLQAEKLLMSLQFSTGSSEIAPHYQEQVAALAQILNSSPNMKIDLSGYTDLTGEASLNQALSQARVESVKTLLMAQGVEAEQIETFAFGEAAPVVANNEREVSFYDRRVVLKLHKSSSNEEAESINNQMANNH